ncbi:MAG: S8 family serine peptidase, partial [Chrysiogenetes bacterium]|nr:S8 family serine peptidase [Chrysiogenetes bacterium]
NYPVPTVTGLTASACIGQNALIWDPAPGAFSYSLYYSTSAFTDIEDATKTSVTAPPVFHTGLSNETTYYYRVAAVGEAGEGLASPMKSATPSLTPMNTPDPLFQGQWHLTNTGQCGGAPEDCGTPGEDLNVQPVWDACLRGEGVRVTVVDEELEIGHEDLDQNTPATGHVDYRENDNDPTGSATREHGTAVGGIIAARDGNGLGVHGVAPRATLIGYNLLTKYSSINLLDSFTRDVVNQDVSNNSWGNITKAGDLVPALSSFAMAMEEGTTLGRDGKGVVYLMAAGNDGGCATDAVETCLVDSNFDGYHNHRGMLIVAAVDADGVKADYSERGANLWISGPAGPGGDGLNITTTDRTGTTGYNDGQSLIELDNINYTNDFAGTSAATPAVAGVVALMLQANPDLGWRDVRHILAQTARKNDAANGEWTTNGAGYNINLNYGFGIPDAQAATACAVGWTNVGTELSSGPHSATPAMAIPDNDMTGISDTISVAASGIGAIEYINVLFSASDHPFAGDLEITLINETDGTESVLAPAHECGGGSCDGYDEWEFATVFHLGEAADGDWTLRVRDLGPLDTGTFESWSIIFYGTASGPGSCP